MKFERYHPYINLATMAVVGLGIIVVFISLLVRLSYSDFKPKCEWLSSKEDALSILSLYPDLDRNHNGEPCEKQFYSDKQK